MVPDVKRKSLIPDYCDDPNLTTGDHIILPSFKDIRRNTLQALYGIEDEKDATRKINLDLLMDRSPKGSVDDAIRSLVDLVNSHPSYATLSSCSGRISLFDPNHGGDLDRRNFDSNVMILGDSEKTDEAKDSDNGAIVNTGKGYGSWLITSHGTISPKHLIEVLDVHAETSRGHALMFKHEPLLLHIAACNMSRARQLLTIACNLGFRESGLMVTPKRITVAIRSHSLSLAVPISSGGNLRPNDDYLTELVTEANNRFHLNEEKLVALEKEIMNQLFTMKRGSQPIGFHTKEEGSYFIASNPLPDLNLWGHAAVCIPNENSHDYDSEIIVLGGYGAGPNQRPKESSNYGCSRSDKVFSLKMNGDICDTNGWLEIHQSKNNENLEVQIDGIKMKRTIFTAREGHASCLLPLHKVIQTSVQSNYFIATFGGRASPARPKDDLILMPSQVRPLEFYNPVDVRGGGPSARWGHSIVALSGVDGKIAVVIGGRDEKKVFDSIHVLSCIHESDGGNCNFHFIWDKIEMNNGIPRFHHSAVWIGSCSLPEENDHNIVVLGGLTSLQMFDDKDSDKFQSATCQKITIKSNNSVNIKAVEDASLFYFGSSSCLLTSSCIDNAESDKSLLVRLGGLCNDSKRESQDDFSLIHTGDFSDIKCSMDDEIDFGSMVHHVVLSLPSKDAKFVSIGGGVQSFAFGQSFATSYSFVIQSGKRSVNNTDINNQTCIITHHQRKSSAKMPLMKAHGQKASTTDVVYVANRMAKALKKKLEALDFLDRNYRMKKADNSAPIDDVNGIIAVPVTSVCLNFISDQEDNSRIDWMTMVEGIGKQDMPYSTAVMGRK